VSEYCKGGDLMESLDKYENFCEQDAGKIIKRLLSAINYCHEKGIIHRDLKPENLMFEGDNCPDNIKVIDFGESLFATVKKMVQQKNVGSLYYMAPEMMISEHNEKCDLWSIGVIAYFLLSGDMAFFGDTAEELKSCVILGEYDYDSDLWDEISKDARDFIDALLTKDINKRLSAEEALTHPWISSIKGCTSCPFHKKASENILKEMKEGKTLKRLKTRTKRTEFQ
jgi:calcium-dependent protein kinase